MIDYVYISMLTLSLSMILSHYVLRIYRRTSR